MSRRTHNRGSVLLMAVGLLTIIALLGGAFLIVAGLNRKVAGAFAGQGRMDVVAKSKLLEVAMLVGQDVPLNDTATWPRSTVARKGVDAIGDSLDDTYLVTYDPAAMVVDPPAGAMKPSGVKDSGGNNYMVGYRVIDGSGMVDINVAEKPAEATAMTVMTASNLSLQRYLNDGAMASQIHTGASTPYMMDEWLAFLGGPAPATTATGRVKRMMASGAFVNVGGLGVRSISRYSLLPIQCSAVSPLTEKVDLNGASEADLYAAFRNVLSGLESETKAAAASSKTEILARTLAIRVLDFRAAPGAPPLVRTVGTRSYFGLTRQPFITKAAYHRDASNDLYAIELFNPYTTTITMTGCKLSPGGGSFEISIAPRGKLVLVNKKDGLAAPADPLLTKEVAGLNLTSSTAILWGSGNNFPIGLVEPGDFSQDPSPDLASGEVRFETIRRDDRLSNAAYSVAVYKSDTSATGDPAVDCPTGLGKPNGDVTPDAGQPAPHPVYVRNGNFINVGDLMRIYKEPVFIGAGGPMPLDKSLANNDPTLIDNGRLPMFDYLGYELGTMANPAVPAGCRATEYFMVGKSAIAADDANKKQIRGLVNINTAPAKVMACLPGLAGFADGETKAAALVAGRPYLTAGAIAKIINQNASMAATAYGTTDTTAYALSAGSDDGLSTAGTDAVLTDLTKKLSAYAWMSNHITVRSDVYVVYIKVQLTAGTTVTAQNYVGVIDRSMVKAATDKPVVLMFSPLN